MNRELAEGLNPELQSALQHLLDEIESLSDRIRESNRLYTENIEQSRAADLVADNLIFKNDTAATTRVPTFCSVC